MRQHVVRDGGLDETDNDQARLCEAGFEPSHQLQPRVESVIAHEFARAMDY